jgi:hypothetical protein
MRSTGLRLVHMKFTFESTLLFLCVAWLSGCAGGGSAKSAWQASAPHPVFSTVLIVGISTDYNQRCNFEFSMASQFSGSSPQPIVSCNSMTQKDPLTRANIERVVAAVHADAVLTTAVASMQATEHKGYTIPYYKVTGQGYVTGPMGDYGVPVAFVKLDSTQSIPTVSGEIHLITKLFDAKDATLVYMLDTQSKTDDLQSSAIVVDTLTGQIGDRLRRDGVIR